MPKSASPVLVILPMEFAFKGKMGVLRTQKRVSLPSSNGLLTPHISSTMSKDKFEVSQELAPGPPIGASTNLFFELK